MREGMPLRGRLVTDEPYSIAVVRVRQSMTRRALSRPLGMGPSGLMCSGGLRSGHLLIEREKSITQNICQSPECLPCQFLVRTALNHSPRCGERITL